MYVCGNEALNVLIALCSSGTGPPHSDPVCRGRHRVPPHLELLFHRKETRPLMFLVNIENGPMGPQKPHKTDSLTAPVPGWGLSMEP
ncbi:unnamed protein product [Boreogadus saida]